MTAIPVRNVYYLLSYAWGLLEEADTLAVETEDLPQVSDLLARLLVSGTNRLLRKGVDCGYLSQTEILSTIRGRVDFGTSSRRLLLLQGKAQCDYEEFLPDLLHNKILKASLQSLVGLPQLAESQRKGVHSVLRRMEGISPLKLTKAHFSRVRLHRNNAHYRLLMHVCELLYDNLLVNEQTGQITFRDLLRDDRQMAKLFEAFVANFYAKESDWDVTAQERISWDCPVPSPLLPEMRADAVLRNANRVLVVECKFYQQTLQDGRWNDRPKLHSAHLYQLTSYLENLKPGLSEQTLEGMLLYPVVGVDLLEDLVIAGKRVRACTLNLERTWREIADQMLGFLAVTSSPALDH